MADPFSITAGIVGIGLAGVKLSRNIYEVVDTFGSARGDVEAIGRELACFVVVVDDLASDFKARRSTYSNKLLQSLRDIIAQCRLRFKEINNLICSVKFHSRGSRFRSSCLWIFREKSVNKIRASLDSLKLTLTVILQTVRLARKKRRRRKHGDKEDRTLLESLIEAQVRSVIHLQKVGQSNHQVPSIPFATQANTGRLSASSNNFAQHPKQTDVTQETASLLLALVPYNSVANGRSPSPPLPSPALAVTSNTIVTGDPSPSDPPRDAHVALPVRRPPTSDGVNTVPAQRSWINHGGNTVDQLLLTWTNNAGPQIANNTTGKFSTDEASSSDDEVQAVDDLDWLEPLIMSEQQMQFEQNITQDDGLVDEDGRPKPPTFAHDSDTYKTPLVTEPNGQTVSFNKHIRKAWIEKPPPLGSEDHVSATLFRILCQNGHAVMYKKVYRDRHEFFLGNQSDNFYSLLLLPSDLQNPRMATFLYTAIPRHLISVKAVEAMCHRHTTDRDGWLNIFHDLNHREVGSLLDFSSELLDKTHHDLAKSTIQRGQDNMYDIPGRRPFAQPDPYSHGEGFGSRHERDPRHQGRNVVFDHWADTDEDSDTPLYQRHDTHSTTAEPNYSPRPFTPMPYEPYTPYTPYTPSSFDRNGHNPQTAPRLNMPGMIPPVLTNNPAGSIRPSRPSLSGHAGPAASTPWPPYPSPNGPTPLSSKGRRTSDTIPLTSSPSKLPTFNHPPETTPTKTSTHPNSKTVDPLSSPSEGAEAQSHKKSPSGRAMKVSTSADHSPDSAKKENRRKSSKLGSKPGAASAPRHAKSNSKSKEDKNRTECSQQ